MSDILSWALSGLLAAVFVAANIVNLSWFLSKRKEGEQRASPVLVVGGIAGALALVIAPHQTLEYYFWVPLVIDLGTGPYFALSAFFTVYEGLRSGAWLKHIPFVRYLAKPGLQPPREPFPKEHAIVGCMLGTAVGDAMGLASEGLSPQRQLRMFPKLTGYHLIINKGLTSDDTEHTCMLAQSLIETGNYHADLIEREFLSNFAWRLRFWLLGLPAGIGLATLRAILKLWLGFPGRHSGVFSAGNGPAMRVALLGVCYGEDMQKMRMLARAATRITHTDPKAEYGALAVALAAHLAATHERDVAPAEYGQVLQSLIGDEAREFIALIRSMTESVERGEQSAQFAAHIGCANGVSGYICHTVPAALHVWLSHQGDYRRAVTAMVRLGGDTDTAAAIVGAITGARVGKAGIPPEWLDNLWEWPRTAGWLEQLGIKLAERCADGYVSGGVPVSLFKLMLRNVLFIVVVLLHGFRRLLPPY